MSRIVGVRLKKVTEIQYFDPADADLAVNDYVVVETSHGLELGQVISSPREVVDNAEPSQIKPIVRKASPEDIKRSQEQGAKEKEALAECNKLISRMNLPMRLLSAEYDFDGKRVTIYFKATDRVDFRDLVRELAGQLRVRVELRQTRPRDEAKILDGCGRCGRPLCCASFLSEFIPVSIKMAKVQNLPLNPQKISGVCGRLMCCLAYETDLYQAMRELLPRDGQRVSVPMGQGRVVSSNPLKETVMVEMDESQATVEVPLADVSVIKSQFPPKSPPEPAPRES